jgi:hypothetical protein
MKHFKQKSPAFFRNFTAKPEAMYHAKYISPVIPSYDIKKTASFFTGLLGFKISRNDSTYMILYKDNVTIHILRAGTDIGEMEFYLQVDNIEEVWRNMKDKIEGMTAKAPFDREYGMREVHVIIPETKTLMFIGQEMK